MNLCCVMVVGKFKDNLQGRISFLTLNDFPGLAAGNWPLLHLSS